MNKPTLIIMAAGMGSRYGGLKQIDPVDEQGHIIMDFPFMMLSVQDFRRSFLLLRKKSKLTLKNALEIVFPN